VTRSLWGWGNVKAALDDAAIAGLGDLVTERFGAAPNAPTVPPTPDDVTVPASRIAPPPALAELFTNEPADRYRHGHGQAFRDVVPALHGELTSFPDAVVRPRDAADVGRVLDWCSVNDVVCTPFGGGSSVVGGVRPPDRPNVSLELELLDDVHDIDQTSRLAHLGAGLYGPALEHRLGEHGLTLRHYPQSFEFSTLGGWIATRAGGHFATGPTHIDDLVAGINAVTPTGTWEGRPLPGSGAGPSPDRLLLGSEGTLAVITDAWVRVRRRPVHRSQATVTFGSFETGLGAVRRVVQAGLEPANCRLLDPVEAALNGAGDQATLVLGFESADLPQAGLLDAALDLVRDAGGIVTDGPHHRAGDQSGASSGGGGDWRASFLAGPYLRDGLIRLGMVVETVETAITWDRVDDLVTDVRDALRTARSDLGHEPIVSVRATHAYRDGVAPYFTIIVPGTRGSEVATWDDLKSAAGDVLVASGATITHHHAVGRDHAPWLDRQHPEPFRRALAAAKAELDPAGILNPGVLGLAST